MKIKELNHLMSNTIRETELWFGIVNQKLRLLEIKKPIKAQKGIEYEIFQFTYPTTYELLTTEYNTLMRCGYRIREFHTLHSLGFLKKFTDYRNVTIQAYSDKGYITKEKITL
jgi:hypothetical protein